jgi:hypothetical protein
MIETCMQTHSDPVLVRIVILALTFTLVAMIPILLFVYDPSDILCRFHIRLYLKYLTAERNR